MDGRHVSQGVSGGWARVGRGAPGWVRCTMVGRWAVYQGGVYQGSTGKCAQAGVPRPVYQ